ncbi:hypothetical protein EW146_g3025 [Bondarzewia mesenterica]|uniref:Uncharacterized protein n=1 Tax=Bondarzewia mesenterica TaxID=1095465 RepID=A0A4S4LYT4_9AGAM|nr:hypothetical protein EW146_g3025 [Bondarzewia mesenterica]
MTLEDNVRQNANIPRSISGLEPGVLDPSQPTRLLRLSGAKLSFASFDPRVASSVSSLDINGLSLKEELYRAKRVVIETLSDGRSYWRFVPRARKAPDVEDEGTWPRIVSICGELVQCSRDQWDIYKLDPEYDCYVQASPQLALITRRDRLPKSNNPPSLQAASSSIPHHKRRLSPPSSPSQDIFPPSAKKRRQVPHVLSSSEEEDEVESMVDQSQHRPPKTRVPSRRTRDNFEAQRRVKREKIARAEAKRAQKGITDDEMEFEPVYTVPSTPRSKPQTFSSSATKRKGDDDSSPDERQSSNQPHHPYGNYKPSKRPRTKSPESDRREALEKRKERERKRAEEQARRSDARKEQKQRAFMEDILADIPEVTSVENGIHEGADQPEDQEPDDEEIRLTAIEESRRKLAELERDKQIWEEAAREREREFEEEQERQERVREEMVKELLKAETERKQRQAEANRRAQAEREAKEKLERERREQAEAWQREKEPCTRTLQDPLRILRRDEILGQRAAHIDAVPWPLLEAPMKFSVEDVDWAAVEKFFKTVQAHMRWQDYKIFVEKSHRRFHPDRWSSRGLLNTITDETERSSLDVAANTVAQALTPLWRETKGR